MTEKQLRNMQWLLKATAADKKGLTSTETDDLLRAIDYELYGLQITDFKQYLDEALPDMPTDTPEQKAAYDAAFDEFYSTDWHIRFGRKTVDIHNDAVVYEGILGTLKDLINDCL